MFNDNDSDAEKNEGRDCEVTSNPLKIEGLFDNVLLGHLAKYQ